MEAIITAVFLISRQKSDPSLFELLCSIYIEIIIKNDTFCVQYDALTVLQRDGYILGQILDTICVNFEMAQ